MTARLVVERAGPLVTVQGTGRIGLQRAGLPESGPLDALAALEGAALVGNPADVGFLELVGFGLRLRVTAGPVLVALTGAEMAADVDGRPVVPRTTVTVASGSTLDVGAPTRGFVGQLHVGGGIQAPPRWGSVATDVRGGYGGIDGRPVAGGDELVVATSPTAAEPGRRLPDLAERWRTRLRVLWSPQIDLFDEPTRQRFLAATFVAGPRRDRLAAVWDHEGPGFAAREGRRARSHPTVFGDVQISGAGEPMALLADRQSTAGYPRIATVITADHPALVQLPTGSRFGVELVGREEAVAALLDQRAKLEAMLHHLEQGRTLDPDEPRAVDADTLLATNLISGVADAGAGDDDTGERAGAGG